MRLALLRRAMPGPVRRRLLDELAAVTATGFAGPTPAWPSRSYDARLEQYARSTAVQARGILELGDDAAAEAAAARLRTGATALGLRARRLLGVGTQGEALEALAVLYGHIGIEMVHDGRGEVVIRRCLFAEHFDEQVCRLVGALDEGVAAGLSGGGRLRFVERITAGASCCRACLGEGRDGA